MAYRMLAETAETIRQSPVRVALALILLITTTVYVCVENDRYRVAEIGEETSSEQTIDLASADDSDLVSVLTDEDDSPAITTQVDGREKYIDARLTHAFVEETEDASSSSRIRVTLVSQEVVVNSPENSPVWLLGVLIEE